MIIMPVAMLECIDVATANNLSTFLRSSSGRADLEFSPNTFGGLVGVAFTGDPTYAYHFFMELITYYPRNIAFIGINEKHAYPDDDYKLTILKDMPLYPNLRNETELRYWVNLKKDFLKAVNKSEMGYEEFLSIIQRCVIGAVTERDMETCALDFKALANGNQRMMNTEVMLDSGRLYDSMSYGFHMQLRAMVHVCYLRLRKFRR